MTLRELYQCWNDVQGNTQITLLRCDDDCNPLFLFKKVYMSVACELYGMCTVATFGKNLKGVTDPPYMVVLEV